MTHAVELRKAYIYAIIAVFVWTGFILVSRLGGISKLTSYDIIAIRYATSTMLFLPFWLSQGRWKLFTRQHIALAMAGGLIYTLLAFSGFKLAPATHAAILLSGFMPFAITIFGYFILKEKPAKNRIIGLLIIAIGVACLAVESFSSGGITFWGDSFLLATAISWSVYSVLLKKWALNSIRAATAVTLITATIYLPIYILFLPKNISLDLGREIALQAVYQGLIANGIQMILYIRAITILGATRMGMFMAFVPALAGLCAVPLLGEPLTIWILMGLLLVSIGALVGSLDKKTLCKSAVLQ